jgi:hypothetical protein
VFCSHLATVTDGLNKKAPIVKDQRIYRVGPTSFPWVTWCNMGMPCLVLVLLICAEAVSLANVNVR